MVDTTIALDCPPKEAYNGNMATIDIIDMFSS
jgi:hypothetical protein